jgi:hypothetical protein
LRTDVGALPTQPTIFGLLAQLRRATACRAEGRGSNARTGRQFHNLNFNRARGRQRTRLAWDEETLGAAPRRATISAPVAEQIRGIRLLNGTTQVQLLPGVAFPDDVKVACPPVKRIVVVRVHVGEPFSSSPDSSRAEQPAYIRRTGERYLVGRPPLFLCSSKVEQSADNRSTAARYRAEEPLPQALGLSKGCVAERD